jgi:hypothetical protein
VDPKDRRLLAEVLRWAYSQGWRPRHGRTRDWSWREWANTQRPERGPWTVIVSQNWTVGVRWRTATGDRYPDVYVDDVTQAVDLLVALRILPAVFSSAFRSGQSLGLYLGGRMPCAHEAVKVGVGT